MKLSPRISNLLLALGALVLAGGLGYAYNELIDFELSGYRATKEFQLQDNQKRDLRRRLIPNVPAVRERILKEQFGDLPEASDIRTEMRLINLWQKWLLLTFGIVSAGCFWYLLFWRRKTWKRRLPLTIVVLAGVSQALPLLILPNVALGIFRWIGLPIVGFTLAYLLADALYDHWRARRGQTAA